MELIFVVYKIGVWLELLLIGCIWSSQTFILLTFNFSDIESRLTYIIYQLIET